MFKSPTLNTQQSLELSFVWERGITIHGDSINPSIILYWNPVPLIALNDYWGLAVFTFVFFFFIPGWLSVGDYLINISNKFESTSG